MADTRPVMEVDDHPYDQGYFARYRGEPRPTTRIGRAGWDDCNAELREERKDTTHD